MRLFVVDDADVMRAHIAIVASDLGHELAGVAASLDLARARLAVLPMPDAILIDGRLVPSDRLGDAVRALARDAPEAAIVTLAALDERDVIRIARDAGACGELLRPVTHRGMTASLSALTRTAPTRER
ncbi:MAG: hypothetical protein NVS2B8_05400 [Vulcanimicrobiaceae bacterium]